MDADKKWRKGGIPGSRQVLPMAIIHEEKTREKKNTAGLSKKQMGPSGGV